MAEISGDKEKYPLLSVIIPVYNAAPYLRQCIDSVANQTYRNLEILLIDDGSTDESPALCDAYAEADARMKVVHKKNEGLVRARKTGASLAAGEYITYVDADDWIDLDAYERILNRCAGNDADLILYGLVEEYEDAAVKKVNYFVEGYYEGREVAEKLYPGMLCGDVFFCFGILPNLVCKLARRELAEKVQFLVSDDVTFGEDTDCTFQMLLAARSVWIAHLAPYHYRKRHDSMVWGNTPFFKLQSLYRDLQNAFAGSARREVLLPQLDRYMLFILLLKAAERFADRAAFRECFAGKRTILYGAGGFGQALYRALTRHNICEIALWVDKKYKGYQELGLPVSIPEKVADCEYDSVFIAVLDTRVCEGIAKSLAAQGVSADKIHYIVPTKDWLDAVWRILETVPEISIVMPVYNGETYLREAVESILAQTFADWELIFVDDCSTDASPAIMEEYQSKDRRIRVIHNETNQKLPRSLNIGFAQARGKYRTWTSDDNRYKPRALEEMLGFLETRRESSFVYADMDFIDASGKITGHVSRKENEIYSCNPVGACFLYRGDAARQVGVYDADLFLVEDYDYWLRFARCHGISHLARCLYEYREHGMSLTVKREKEIAGQLYKLRSRELDFLLANADEREKARLFWDMWRQPDSSKEYLKERFYGEKGLPRPLRWIERTREMDEEKKIILFGAGAFGQKALDYFGEDRVAYYLDNNAAMAGKLINGKEVLSFARFLEIRDAYQTVISVDARKVPALAAQLEENGVTEYVAYLELVNHLKKPSEGAVSWLKVCEKARGWIERNSVPGGGIINNSRLPESYPEVTGYYIPTLMRWGFSELAVSYAQWLCSIQHADGAWYDTEGKNPYVFDTAQILKGLLAVRDRVGEADAAVRKGCGWILSHIQENGRLTTPSKEEWGEEDVCSELIHLYCLSPLYEAADVYGEPKYREAAEKAADYYITEHGEEIRSFGFLSHFYAYVMEALCDIGRKELARECMKRLETFLDEKGYVPAYRDVNWVCSTGMFQLAIVWYQLGDIEHGNQALHYAAKLQNESGGWYGSYPAVDRPKAADRAEYPDYMPDAEISWAVKYFLDAVYYKNKLEFERQADSFSDEIAEDDGRYQVVLGEVKHLDAKKVLDVGCGKGRYLKNLQKAVPGISCSGVDLSVNVMADIPVPIEKKEGILTELPYADETFDFVYAAESLEHSIFPDNALRELLRVTAAGGEVVVIDKNKAATGLLEIDEWEQWFEDELFERIAEEENRSLRVIENVSYDGGIADGLFRAWILKK